MEYLFDITNIRDKTYAHKKNITNAKICFLWDHIFVK